MAAKRIGIIGKGRVGSALARGLTRAEYDVRAVGDSASVRETVLDYDSRGAVRRDRRRA